MYNIGAYYGNSETIMEKMQKFETTLYKIDDCVLTLVERFDEAFIKLLKDCDLHSNEYVERYIDEFNVREDQMGLAIIGAYNTNIQQA
ncbi:eukaryotic translation initiation factor 3 subunit C-like isoform X4 [Temnothorax americanus]|uniref:eukaryotic translation initiation factor 3 subunit C-like isoform X4 n=1 Tax=Temnothorax americanus TaxID=1964332 RepID=UPI0040695E1C